MGFCWASSRKGSATDRWGPAAAHPGTFPRAQMGLGIDKAGLVGIWIVSGVQRKGGEKTREAKPSVAGVAGRGRKEVVAVVGVSEVVVFCVVLRFGGCLEI